MDVPAGTVEGSGSAVPADVSESLRAEDLGPVLMVGENATRPGAEDTDCHVTESQRAFRPTADDPGVHACGDTSVLDPERRPGMRHAIALAISALFVALYVELGDEFFLVAATTALGLVVYWIADQHQSIRSRR